MPSKFTAVDEETHAYIVEHGARRDDVQRAVEGETYAMGAISSMLTAPDQAALITLLVRSIGARRAIEVGTFTGYGAIAIARGLPEDGELICCELSDEYAELSRRNLERAGVADRVEIRLGEASATLAAIPRDDAFDFAYIDAAKTEYPDYYEHCLELLRPGGLIMLDNMLLGGRAIDPPDGDEAAETIARLNEALAGDERIDVAMLGIADGVTLARKR